MDKKQIKVVKVIDDFTIVINNGDKDGIKQKDIFQIYEFGEEIIDPDTEENLGLLEISKGIAKVEHLQDKITTLSSNNFITVGFKRIIKENKSNNNLGYFNNFLKYPGKIEEIEEIEPEKKNLPFKNVKVGDYAKVINKNRL